MQAQNPEFREYVRKIFESARFISHLGIELTDIEAGTCGTRLTVRAEHAQQDGVVHAGVIATMADHTAGGSAGTLLRKGQRVLSVEFKMNYLRPAAATELRCNGTVLKAGRTLTIAESEVFAIRNGESKLAAKGTFTLAVLDG